MKPLINPKLHGIKLYIQIFLDYLIFGHLFRKERGNIKYDKCKNCGKLLINRRIELSIQIPDLDYCIEHDYFFCVKCAIQFLLQYKKRGFD